MKFIENVKVDQRALDFMLANTGRKRPVIPPEAYQREMQHTWEEAGYDLETLYWESFGWEEFPFKVELPFDGKNVKWWFSKLPPGSVFPFHQDIYSTIQAKRRLWIAYQNYVPGHVFAYEDKVLTGYKAGDMFEFDDTAVWHGAANCGLIPKISLQLVVL